MNLRICILNLCQSLTNIKTLNPISCDINSGGFITIGKLNVVTIIFTTTVDVKYNTVMVNGLPTVNYLKCTALEPISGKEYGMFLFDGAIKSISTIPKGVKLHLTLSFITI